MSELLVADAITAAYPGHRPILRDATFRLTSGRKVVILGSNGSGKTTLLRCLSGNHKPTGGQIRREGKVVDYSRADLREHRHLVQLVLQDPDDQLFSADVAQDVSFGPMNMRLPEAEVRERVAEALELMGITELAGRATHQLSYGERKRVATAGAVAMRPSVLLLDEPSAGLDPAGVNQLFTALNRLHDAGTTIALATHDVDFALAWADEAAVVADGHVTQGPVAEILSDEELAARAHLHRPMILEIAAKMGLDTRPKNVAELVALLYLT